MRIVFDLDGTLADPEHRNHILKRNWPERPDAMDWDEYFHACEGDAPIEHTINVFRGLRGRLLDQNVIEIWSGRSEGAGCLVRKKTMAWLRHHVCHGFVGYETSDFFRPPEGRWQDIVLRMRPHGDHRPDYEIKREWLNEARAHRMAPELVFEDRDQVVSMWRSEGVPCFQVKCGDY